VPVSNTDPRLEGIIEQFERARVFLREAQQHTDLRERFRRLMAAVYFGRAAVEIMLEAADMEVVRVSRSDLEQRLVAALPGYMLLEKLRIHDFHRFGVLPRDGMFMGGMVTFRVQDGHAAMALFPSGPERSTSGQSKIIERRALHMNGPEVFDEESSSYVTVDTVLLRYLEAMPKAIEMFRAL
jgi:hypothetical protein